MKKLYKIMFAALVIFSCFVPLSVSAQEDSSSFVIISSFTLSNEQVNYLNNNFSSLDNLYIYSLNGTSGDINIISNSGTFNFISNTDFYFTGDITRVQNDGSILALSISDQFFSTETEWASWVSFPLNVNACSVISNSSSLIACGYNPNPTPTPTPTPTPDGGWDADFNEILSNPYIAQLVGVAKDNDIESWYIDFTIKRTPNGTSGYTIKTLGYQYSFTLYDSNSYYLESIIFNQIAGEECNGSVCRPLTSYTVSVENVTILKSSWLDVPDSGPIEVVNPSGNDLLENGNSNTQDSTSSVDSVTSSLNSSASQYESFESQFNSSLTSSLDNIDVNSINLVNSNDFVKTAAWVKVQFDDVLDSSGIYKTAISFVLIIGLALLLLGRRL